jgi:hypothetical protein
MQVKVFAILSSIAIFIFVIELIREQKMTFKYSLTWLAVSALVLFFAVFDGLLDQIASWVGFELPSNFIFFLLLVFVILFSLLLTIHINEQNSRNETLAQSLAILEYKMKQIRDRQKT